MAPLPRLSVVSFTNGPIDLFAASLERVRSLATEIVVAVDARVDPEALAPLVAIADRVVRADYVTPFEANLAWLDSLATGDWVLQLDGDDVVSSALLDRLATPGWDDGITHAYVSYRWLWPMPDRMLDQGPWWPDPVLRLFRNVPGITRYPSTTHSGRQVVGDHRFLDEAIYHLDLVLNPPDARARKVAAYERETPGHRTERGWAVSPTAYLPEEHPHAPRTTAVPAVDLAAITDIVRADPLGRAALDRLGWPLADERHGRPASEIRPTPAVPWPQVFERDLVVTAESRTAPAPGPGELELRLVGHDPVGIVAGLPATITVGVRNRSGHRWGPHDVPATQVGARLRSADADGSPGEPLGPELRVPLPGPVGPGDEILVRVPLPPTLPIGSAIVAVGALQEGIAWHDAWLSVMLDVRSGRRVVVAVTPDDRGRAQADAVVGALAFRLPDVVPSVVPVPEGPFELDTDLPVLDARAADLDVDLLLTALADSLPPPPPLT